MSTCILKTPNSNNVQHNILYITIFHKQSYTNSNDGCVTTLTIKLIECVSKFLSLKCPL